MTDRELKNNGARRRLLKSVVAGGGVLATGKLLPENWARPVVQSVVLPAHAQTSPGSFDGLYVFDRVSMGDALDSQPGSILDMFVSPAHAAHLTCNAVSRIQIEVNGDNADICFTYFGDNRPGSTSVNESTGELADAEIAGLGTELTGMQVSSDATRIDGDVRHCFPFVATRTSGSLSCLNVSTNMFLSSPFADKA
ncbi:MAG: hypothetical protein U5R46_00320 [Gammaproteobacteria bacterium]|nr:hypothetical protein [Gammaproteobacteria bacterium]